MRVLCFLLLPALLVAVDETQAAPEVSGRIKAFADRTFLPEDDFLRRRDGTPRDRGSLDLRLGMRLPGRSAGALDGEIAWELIARHDSAGIDEPLAAPAEGDGERFLLDLEHGLVSGTDSRLEQRLDRLWAGVRLGEWRLKAGRQAASFGNGLVFQPMDLFNPFAPTEIDRDYKRGVDMLQLSRPFDDGSEAGLIAVGRRDGQGPDLASLALRHRRLAGTLATEVLAGVHLDDPLLAAGLSGPVGTAVWRLDLVTQRVADDWVVSGIANLDWSLVVLRRNLHLFAEFYRNGFGLDAPSITGLDSRPALRRRLQRGELFTLGRHHLALGGTLEWHPLVHQRLLLIREFQDGSHLLQTTLSWEPDDHQRWQFSLVLPLGGRGEEFGRLETGMAPDGRVLTAGGGERLLLRWSRYF